MADLCTKFEVSRFTHYETMKGRCKMQKMGWLRAVRRHPRSWAMPP